MNSDDPHTQTHARLTAVCGTVIEAANAFPPGVERNPERLARPAKYNYIEHAERVAIGLAAARGIATAGAHLELDWFPCNECARLISFAGVASISVAHRPQETHHGRYAFEAAREILDESGVRIIFRSNTVTTGDTQ